jgi:hypothetical protein
VFGGMGVVASGSTLFALEQEKDPGANSLRAFEIGRPDNGRDRASERFWTGGREIAHPQRLSFARSPGGRWTLAGSFHKGGGRGLRFWSGTGDPWRPSSTGVVRDRRFFSAAPADGPSSRSDLISLDALPLALTFDDLTGPQLLESRGAIHVVAQGWSPGLSWIWIAPVPALDGPGDPGSAPRRTPPLAARVIASGVEPRVVRAGDAWVVASREAEHEFRPGPARIRFHRSVDLTSWSPDAALSRGIEAESSYDVAAIGGRTWVATTITDRNTQSIRLSFFAPELGKWVEFATHDVGEKPVPFAEPFLWLVGRGERGEPVVVFRTRSGELKVFR